MNKPVTDSNFVLRAAADLFPGYFALVMATGIISIACYLLAMTTLSFVLLVVNIVAFALLWLLLLLRLVLVFRARQGRHQQSRARAGILYCGSRNKRPG